MTRIIYDGSFDGLLTAIFECFEYKFEDVKIIAAKNNAQETLFTEEHIAITNLEKSKRVLSKLEKTIGKKGITQLLMVFFSEREDLEFLILNAIKQSISYPNQNILENYGDENILEISKIVKSVGRESHRMKAFIRFEKLEDETFYAKIEPDFNVLPLIQNHFRERYKDQKWMIFDIKRNFGIVWDLVEFNCFQPEEKQLYLLKNPQTNFHSEEKHYQKMWQQYFVHTGIKSRKNMKLHIQWMPKRYWKYLTEKQLTN